MVKRTIPEVNHAINECTICLSKPSDSVIGPCGHGGICFECCQKMITDAVKIGGKN
jgi:Zinc finger, C3HC4 type (RING finger)